MSHPWITIAPVRPSWFPPKDLILPYYFNERVSYRSIPDWALGHDSEGDLGSEVRRIMAEGATHCLAVEYTADGLGSPDLNLKGSRQRSAQAAATELVSFLSLSLWLARPMPFQVEFAIHASNFGSAWVMRASGEIPCHLLVEKQVDMEQTIEDFEKARAFFLILTAPSLRGTVRTAAEATVRALSEPVWALRFLMLWLGVESLFGPEDARGEITFQLSQRAALFLEKDSAKAKELFAQLKASYGWRSKIVHGLRLANLNNEKSYALLVELQDIVRRSLIAILDSATIAATFDGKERELYLDGLAFG